MVAKHGNKQTFMRCESGEAVENVLRLTWTPYQLHDLILCQTTGRFGTLHNISTAKVRVLDESEAKGASTILIAGEFSCCAVSIFLRQNASSIGNLPIAVSAFSALSNCTTPVPRERPFGSYWISARSTFPIVVKSSTKSSLLVDHGSCLHQRHAKWVRRG